LVGLGIVIGATVLSFRPEREPEYGGKKLSEWVDIFSTADTPNLYPARTEAAEAISRMGTNAIPFLVNWMSYDEPAWMANLYKRAYGVIKLAPTSWDIHYKRLARQSGAFLFLLGTRTDAGITIPEVTRLLNAPNASANATEQAAAVLATFGDAGLVPIVECLTNHPASPRVREALLHHLGYSGTRSRAASPIVQSFLRDPDFLVRHTATQTLWIIDRPEMERISPPPDKAVRARE